MKIICIGRNYTDHIAELKNEKPSEPVIFMKPDSAILPKNNPLYIPPFTQDLHYEVEMVVRIKKVGKHIAPKFAAKYIKEIGIGIDFTARDLQQQLKEKGLPWEKAKGFDGSAVLGEKWIPYSPDLDLANINFGLSKNGEEVQKGNTSLMLYKVEDIIAYVSQFYTLKIGDLIFTGTPAGVGPVAIGDVLTGTLEGEEVLNLRIK